MMQLDKQRPTHELTGYGDVACLRWWEDDVEKNSTRMEKNMTLMRMRMMMMIRGPKVAILRWAKAAAYTLVFAS